MTIAGVPFTNRRVQPVRWPTGSHSHSDEGRDAWAFHWYQFFRWPIDESAGDRGWEGRAAASAFDNHCCAAHAILGHFDYHTD